VSLLAIVGALLTAGAAQAAPASVVNFNRQTYSYSSTLSIAQEANRYQVIVLEPVDHAMVAPLKAANPNLKVLMYTNLLASSPIDQMAWGQCTAYATDNAQHPNWFLLDQSGHRIGLLGYAGNYLMDVGNPAYQQACISRAASMAHQYGFDGVYFDGATANLIWAVPTGTSVAAYPTQTGWLAAEYSILSYATPQLHAQHLLSVANIGGGATVAGLWQKWNSVLDGAEEESWMDTSVAYYWPQMLADAAWSEANGKLAVLHSHYTTQAGNRFALAAMMLNAGGQSSYSTANADYQTSELWFPDYTLAQSLGAPIGPYRHLSNGADTRVFANGLVVVNPMSTGVPTFSLGGGTYTGSGLTNVRSVSLAPASGLILRRVSAGVSSTTGSGPSVVRRATVRCIVPKVTHAKLARAKTLIRRAHCRVGRITQRRSTRRNRHHVLAQNPAPHRRLAAMTRVDLMVGR
jgi:hypothetical protein